MIGVRVVLGRVVDGELAAAEMYVEVRGRRNGGGGSARARLLLGTESVQSHRRASAAPGESRRDAARLGRVAGTETRAGSAAGATAGSRSTAVGFAAVLEHAEPRARSAGAGIGAITAAVRLERRGGRQPRIEATTGVSGTTGLDASYVVATGVERQKPNRSVRALYAGATAAP